jgi:hypothetical protein
MLSTYQRWFPVPMHGFGLAAQQQQQRKSGGAAELQELRLAVPHSFDELRSVRHTLELYRQNYAVQVVALLCTTHMFLQVG